MLKTSVFLALLIVSASVLHSDTPKQASQAESFHYDPNWPSYRDRRDCRRSQWNREICLPPGAWD
jgi:hypothetical protein